MADFLRQLDIMNPAALFYPVTLIGLGGIGSFTAETLRKMGFRHFTLYDRDKIEAHNIPCQNYDSKDLGEKKVYACADKLSRCLDSALDIETHPQSFNTQPLEGIVVSGVDRMSARRAIWDAVQQNCALIPLYVDGRIGVEWGKEEGRVRGEWIEVFTLRPSHIEDMELYEPHLFSDAEADELHCTAQAVVYVGNFIAALISSNIKKWVLNERYPRHLIFDSLTLDFVHVTY